MTCEHLAALEKALLASGFKDVYRGQAWSKNCREWVYFDCHLDLPLLRMKFSLDARVTDHVHRGTHDGSEAGFVCNVHWDAVMGLHPDDGKSLPVFKG